MNKLGNIGLLMAGLALLVWALQLANKPSALETLSTVSKPDYQIVQLGEMARNQFLLDKNNGRIWQRVCNGESKGPDCDGDIMWAEMYIDNLTPRDNIVALAHQYITEQHAKKIETEGKKISP